MSQQEGINSDTGHSTTEAISLSSLNQLEAPRFSSPATHPTRPPTPPSCCLQGHWEVIEWPRRLCVVLSASVSLYLNIRKNPIFPIYEYMGLYRILVIPTYTPSSTHPSPSPPLTGKYFSYVLHKNRSPAFDLSIYFLIMFLILYSSDCVIPLEP